MKRDRKKRYGGFSLVELLTTLAVIGVLLALLIPALNQVQKTALNVKQKAQFHAIGTSLEAFRNDYGDYPPSAYNGAMTKIVTGSHNLAEALVGRDGLGFHPESGWRSDGLSTAGQAIYYPDYETYLGTLPAANQDAARQANLAARKGPYMELESANAVRLGNLGIPAKFPTIYPTGLALFDQNGYVLADMYKIVKNAATGKEVGMPILYYKANRMRIGNSPYPPDWDTINAYNFNDAFCLGNGFIRDDTLANVFYNAIKNPNFTAPERPYRADSFLLHSAGPDGLYGTPDDVFNFDQDK